MIGPLGAAGAGAAAVALLHVWDPHRPGAYGVCPFHALTGWWCPGCGGLRGVNDLTDGHVAAALHSNVLLLPLAVVAAVVWVRWCRMRLTGRPGTPFTLSTRAGTMILVLMAVFTVVRNTPWGHWLSPA
jgi:hypothetical protein